MAFLKHGVILLGTYVPESQNNFCLGIIFREFGIIPLGQYFPLTLELILIEELFSLSLYGIIFP